jgi:hypothetical protein
LMSLSRVPQQAGSSFSSTTTLSPKQPRIFVRLLSLSSLHFTLPLSYLGRRTLHWRKGRRQVRKAPMVQRQWLSSCHQEVRSFRSTLTMTWTFDRSAAARHPQIHDPGWRFHGWKWSVLCLSIMGRPWCHLISHAVFCRNGRRIYLW